MPRFYASSKKRPRVGSGRAGKKRSVRRKLRYKTVRRAGTSGYLRLVRLSNKDNSKNVHWTIAGNNSIPSGSLAFTFALDDVAGVGELKSLFDNFRIVKIKYRFVIERDPAVLGAAGTTGVGNFPRLNWVHDFNDSTAISRPQMMQHAAMREFWFSESRQATPWYTLNPSSLVQMYESSTTTGYKPSWRSWVDTSDSSMPHYGIKLNYDNLYSTNSLYLEAKYVIECKGVS